MDSCNKMPITQFIHLLPKFQTVSLMVSLYLSIEARWVDSNRSDLIQSITLVMPVADKMRQRDMIHQETYNKIEAAATSQDKMRDLYKALTTTKVKSAFYRILQEIQPQACGGM